SVPGGDWRRIASASTGFSAVVTYPVASTNRRNWALVTSVSSAQKPFTRTRWAGFSSGQARGEAVPLVNSPAGGQDMPGRAGRRGVDEPGDAEGDGEGAKGEAREDQGALHGGRRDRRCRGVPATRPARGERATRSRQNDLGVRRTWSGRLP